MIRSNSVWNLQEIERFLAAQRIPIRLACLTSGGGPIVCSLWYFWADDALWCATQQTARVVQYLDRNPRCGFEIAPESPPYKGVRGQGKATLSAERGGDVLSRLIDRYLGPDDTEFARWLLDRSASEVAIRIEPTWLTSWDFSRRMRGPRPAAAK